MTVTDPYTEPQPLAPPATVTEPPKKRPTRLIIAAVAAGVVVLAAAAIAVMFAMKPSGPDPTKPTSAIPACREQVKARMKAPATTKFPGGETVENDGLQDKIVGVYDSQNGFGALVRGSYRCLLAHDDAGHVQVASVSVSE